MKRKAKEEWIKSVRKSLYTVSSAEFMLMGELKREGLKFERNYPIELKQGGHAFLDFFFPEGFLAVELDGEDHKKWKDDRRDAQIQETLPGIEIKRFKNKAVFRDIRAVAGWIMNRLGRKYEPLETWADSIPGLNAPQKRF